MANKITYNIGFNVDSSGLKQVQAELQKINNMSTADIKLINPDLATRDINKIKDAAKKASELLQNSFNVKLDSYDLKKFNQELQRSPGLMSSIRTELIKLGPTGSIQLNNLTKEILTMNTQVRQTSKVLDNLGKTFMNTLRWSVASSALNAISGSIQQAWGYTKKLDTSLNDIRIVTGKSADEMERFAKQANKAAKSLGASTTAYTNASLIYYQQGLGEEDVQARSTVTLKAANVTGQSAAEVSQQLTAVWNGYKVVAEEAELYVDKLAAVAATTAADLEELSDGMSKVASAANTMGVDIDQLSAQLATIVSVTRQDASLVGTALKTIYARMGDLKVSGVDEFGTSLGDVSGQLRQMGIEVLDQEGNLRDMGEVIEEVAAKWGTWTDAQQQAAAVAIAGKRQYNNLIALFENWGMYESALNTSHTSEGTLQKQQETYMDSLEGHLNQLSVASEKLYDALIDNDAIKGFIDLLTGVVNIFGDITAGVGGAIPMLLSLGGVLGKIFNAQLSNGIKVIGGGIKTALGIGAEAYGMKHPKEVAREQIAREMGWDPNHKMTPTEEKMVSIQEDKLKISKYLTEEQEKQFELQIKIAAEKGNALEKLKAEQKLLKEETNDIEKRAKAYVKDGRVSDPNTFASDLRTKQSNINKAKTAFTASDFWKNKDELVDTTGTKAATGIAVKDRKSFKGKTEEELKAYAKSFSPDSKAATTMNTLIKVKQQETQIFQSLGDTGTKAYKELQEWQEKFYKGEIDATTYTKKMAEALNNAEKEAGELAVKIVDVAEASDKMKQDINDATLAVEQADNAYKDFKADTEKGIKINQITETISSLTAFAGACMSIANIFKIVQDESLSTGEKVEQVIFAILGAIAAAIPAVVSMLAMLQAEATASLGWIGLILMAVSLVTTLIISLAQLPKPETELEKSQKALEEAKEAAKKAHEAVDQLRGSFADLKEEISNFKEARLAIDEMRVGTEEWKQAVESLKWQVMDLIQKYPALTEYLTVDENGVYGIRQEGIDALITQTRGQLSQAVNIALLRDLSVQKRTYENNALNYQEGRSTSLSVLADALESGAYSKKRNEIEIWYKTPEALYNENGDIIIDGRTGTAKTKDIVTADGQVIDRLKTIFSNSINLETERDNVSGVETAFVTFGNSFFEKMKSLNESEIKQFQKLVDSVDDPELKNALKSLRDQTLSAEGQLKENEAAMIDQTKEIRRAIGEEKGFDGEVYSRITENNVTTDDFDIDKIKESYTYTAGKKDNDIRTGKFWLDKGWFKDGSGNEKIKGIFDEADEYALLEKYTKQLVKATYGENVNFSFDTTKFHDVAQEAAGSVVFGTVNGQEMTLEQLMDAWAEIQIKQKVSEGAAEDDAIMQALTDNGLSSLAAFFLGDNSTKQGENLFTAASLQSVIAQEGGILAATGKEWTTDPTTYLTEWQAAQTAVIKEFGYNAANSMFSQFTQDDFTQFAINMKKATAVGADEAVRALFDEIGDDPVLTEKVNSLMAKVNWNDASSVQSFRAELIGLGIDITSLGSDWDNFINSAISGTKQWVSDSKKVIANLNTIKSIAADLSAGDIISEDEFKQLLAIAPEVANMFIKTADGMQALFGGDYISKAMKQQYSNLSQIADEYTKIRGAATAYGTGNAKLDVNELTSAELITNFNRAGIKGMANVLGLDWSAIQEAQALLKDPNANTSSTAYIAAMNNLQGWLGQINQAALDAANGVFDSEKAQEIFVTEIAGSWKDVTDNWNQLDPEVQKKAQQVWNNKYLTELGFSGEVLDKLGKVLNPAELEKQIIEVRKLELDYLAKTEHDLNKINTELDRAFGGKRIKMMQEQQQIILDQQEIALASANSAINAFAAETVVMRNAGYNFVDENGNFDYVAARNAQSKFSKNSPEYQNIEAYISMYNTMREKEQESLELSYELIDAQVSALTYQKEIAEEYRELIKEFREFSATYSDFLGGSTDFATLFGENFFKDLGKLSNSLTTSDIIGVSNEYSSWLTEAGWDGSKFDLTGSRFYDAQLGTIDEAGWKDFVSNTLSEGRDAFEEMYETASSLYQEVLGANEELLEIYEEQIEKLNNVNTLISESLDLYKLIARQGGNKYLTNVDTFTKNMRDNIAAIYTLAEEEYTKALAAYNALGETADQSLRESAAQALATAQTNQIKALQEALSLTADIFSREIAAAIDQAFVDATGMTLDNFSEDWSREQDLDSMYLDATNSAYESEKMLREFQKSIDKTDNAVAQNKLIQARAEAEARLNKIMEERGKLSQYELDRENALYELTLKQIALEEAQQTANTMKLTRDAFGNYSYQYVSDEDQIAEAEAELAEAQNNLYNLDKEKTSELISNYTSKMQEFTEKYAEAIATGDQGIIDAVYEQYMGENGILTLMRDEITTLSGLDLGTPFEERLDKLAALDWSSLLSSAANITDKAKQDASAIYGQIEKMFAEGGSFTTTVEKFQGAVDAAGLEISDQADKAIKTFSGAVTRLSELMTSESFKAFGENLDLWTSKYAEWMGSDKDAAGQENSALQTNNTRLQDLNETIGELSETLKSDPELKIKVQMAGGGRPDLTQTYYGADEGNIS